MKQGFALQTPNSYPILYVGLIKVAVQQTGLVGQAMEPSPDVVPFVHRNIAFKAYLGTFPVYCDTGINGQFFRIVGSVPGEEKNL